MFDIIVAEGGDGRLRFLFSAYFAGIRHNAEMLAIGCLRLLTRVPFMFARRGIAVVMDRNTLIRTRRGHVTEIDFRPLRLGTGIIDIG